MGTILRTKDGGGTWTRLSSGTFAPLSGVSFVDAKVGTAVGGRAVLRTNDGGAIWRAQTSGTNNLVAVSFVDAKTGTAVGYFGSILRTTTGGE